MKPLNNKKLLEKDEKRWRMYEIFSQYITSNPYKIMDIYEGFIYEGLCSDSYKIIDVACGSGYSTAKMADLFPNSHFIGLDTSPEAIEFARKHNSRKNVDYILADFFDFKESGFDFVFALEILEHLKSKVHYKFVNHAKSLVKDSGRLFLTTPNALDEKDCKMGHIGLLNRKRAAKFIRKYEDSILDSFFYDKKQDIIRERSDKYGDIVDASHFAFVFDS